MPSIYQLASERANKILEEAEEILNVIKDFNDAVEQRAAYNSILMEDTYGRLLLVTRSLNRIMSVFGASINISGINIEQLLSGFFQMSQAKQQQEEQRNTVIESYAQIMAANNAVMEEKRRELFEEVYGEINRASELLQRTTRFRELSLGVRASARALDSELRSMAGFITALSALDQSVEEIIGAVFDFADSVLSIIASIVEFVSSILNILQVAGVVADVPPFNTLPGTLAVVQGYLALVLALLNDIASTIGDFSEGIYDFSEISLKVKVLFNTKLMNGAGIVGSTIDNAIGF